MTRIYFGSLGCRLNQSEMDAIARRVVGNGHQVVARPEDAEICVLNSCAVTAEAERKSRQALRRIHRENPAAQVIATGCYATLFPDRAGALVGVEQVIPNPDKHNLPLILGLESRNLHVIPVDKLDHGRTRAFVQIQDGCDNRCSYCITTIARGPAHSRPPGDILSEIQSLTLAGYREVVLTGVHVGNYGREKDERRPAATLTNLIQGILRNTDIERLRLSSLEPWDIDPNFFELWQNRRLCRQLHLPLQSGSAAILRRMGRRTTPSEFRVLAKAALQGIPDLALTTDIIVGFPGETEQNFAESMDFIREIDFSRLHVFRFSLRPGTAAAGMPDQVSPHIMQRRSQMLRELAVHKQNVFLACFIGRTMPVLWESRVGDDLEPPLWRGHTDNYITVTAASHRSLQNEILPAKLCQIQAGSIRGQLLQDGEPSS